MYTVILTGYLRSMHWGGANAIGPVRLVDIAFSLLRVNYLVKSFYHSFDVQKLVISLLHSVLQDLPCPVHLVTTTSLDCLAASVKQENVAGNCAYPGRCGNYLRGRHLGAQKVSDPYITYTANRRRDPFFKKPLLLSPAYKVHGSGSCTGFLLGACAQPQLILTTAPRA